MPALSAPVRPRFPLATLGSAARKGAPVAIYCNNRVCPCEQQHGRQYTSMLTAADLARLADRYGTEIALIDFRRRLRCRHCGSGTIVLHDHETPAARWEREAAETDNH
jgi:hypothetical protein